MMTVRELLAVQNCQITKLLQYHVALELDDGSTRAAVAEKIGVTPQDLSRWLNGVGGKPFPFSCAGAAKITLWLGLDSIGEMLVMAQELEMQE